MGRRAASSILCATLALVALPACGTAQQHEEGSAAARRPGGGIALKRIGSFDSPTYVTAAPGFPQAALRGRAGRAGSRSCSGGRELRRPFLDIRGLVGDDGGERGLLSIAFPPDYPQSGRLYVYYTDGEGNIRVDEFHRRSADQAARGSRRAVIEIPHPVNANHNGGQLQFLGDLLYLGTGDGGSGGDPPNNAQNQREPAGQAAAHRPPPQRRAPLLGAGRQPLRRGPGTRRDLQPTACATPSASPSTRLTARQPRIAIADVGQNRFEELDYTTVAAASGANFGWDALRGLHRPTPKKAAARPTPAARQSRSWPTATAATAAAARSSAATWSSDPRLTSLRGRYVYTDFCSGQLRSLVPQLAASERRPPPRPRRPHPPPASAKTAAAASTSASQGGPVYRLDLTLSGSWERRAMLRQNVSVLLEYKRVLSHWR